MKNGKKIILTLAATLILSTSVGHAQSITIKTKSNTDSSKYLQYKYGNFIIKLKPIYNWNIDDTKNNTSNDNKGQENNGKPEKPNTPAPETEKPVETEKPQTPEKPKQETPDTDLSVEREVAKLVNIERQKTGLAPLTFSEEISRVAEAKSQDMANKNYFSHTSPTYGDPFQMMKSFGIKFGYAGENIAKGYRDAQSVMNGWMNSSGHRANILNSNFKKIGVGYVAANGTTYWTQMFTD